ncbi:Eukaryotic translation initiation factor 2 alpha subunit [Entamoeba marina]
MSQPTDTEKSKLKCRMYENKFPDEDDLCLINVTSTSEMGTYVTLKEYNDIQGMIPMSELTRRKFKQARVTRAGKSEVVTVIKVNAEKEQQKEEKAAYLAKYALNKEAHLIMRLTAKKLDLYMEDLYTQFGWPLARKYGTLHDAFKKSLVEPEVLDTAGIEPNVLEVLKPTIAHYMTIQPLKFRADIDVYCYEKGGVKSVRDALTAGIDSVGETELTIKLVSSPTYGMFLTHLDRVKGMEAMHEALSAVKRAIEKVGGECVVKRQPCVVSKEQDIDEFDDDSTTSQD